MKFFREWYFYDIISILKPHSWSLRPLRLKFRFFPVHSLSYWPLAKLRWLGCRTRGARRRIYDFR